MRSKLAGIVCVALLLASCGEGSGASSRSANGDRESRTQQPQQREPERDRVRNKTRAPKADPHETRRKREKAHSPIDRGAAAFVSRVIDGDTIEVQLRGVVTDVRLIGFDTPETVHPTERVECFGKAASSYAADALEGRRVTLEFDAERRDHYGRTLAYVWLGNQLFNEKILRDGFAQVATYPPNVRYVERFLAAQRIARAGDKGLWSACGEGEEALGRIDKPKGLITNGNCDPNYSGACVPAYPPDIDCSEMRTSDFRSKGSDPHGFDGDGDGIACETY